MGNPLGEAFAAAGFPNSMDGGSSVGQGQGSDPSGAGGNVTGVGGDAGQAQQLANYPSNNPSHAEFYQAIPKEYHDTVTPLLQKWDQGVQKRFEEVQSNYAPWQDVINSGNNPEDVVLALNVLQTMMNNPRQVFDALNEEYRFLEQQSQSTDLQNGQQLPGANGQGHSEPSDFQTAYDQRIAAMEANFQRLAEVQLQNMQEAQAAQEDQALDAELSNLRKQYGEYDEDFVLAKMQAGMDAEEAVKTYQQLIARVAGQNQPRPLILGTGGGNIPGQGLDPRKMSDKEAKSAAVQMIMAMNRENQQ